MWVMRVVDFVKDLVVTVGVVDFVKDLVVTTAVPLVKYGYVYTPFLLPYNDNTE